jgi:hypothetical protein
MVLDIRATVTSNLGDVISANLSDSYIQGSGLITTQGSCLIDGIVTPSVGSIVTFSYEKDGVTTNIPRKMRVLSRFADPYRRTTQVELGCKLTYMAAVKEPVLWRWLNDPENSTLTTADSDIIVIPIRAYSIAVRCLYGIGISLAPGSSLPLTNEFSIKYFDYSSGYVGILSDLLVSESYCGYLNFNEQLVVIPLTESGGTGPVLTEDEIIDIRSINVGEIPGDVVYVNYNTQVLKNATPEPSPESEVEQPLPDPGDPPENPTSAELQTYWEEKEEYTQQQIRYGLTQREQGSPATSVITYKNGETGNVKKITTTHVPLTTTVSQYEAIQKTNTNNRSTSIEEEKCTSQSSISTGVSGITASGYFQAILNKLGDAGLAPIGINTTAQTDTEIIKTFTTEGEDEIEIEEKYETALAVAGQMGLPWAYINEDGSVSYVSVNNKKIITEKTIRRRRAIGETEKSITYYYRLWHQTHTGGLSTSNLNEDSFEDASGVLDYFDTVLSSGPVFDYATVSDSWSTKPASIASQEERKLDEYGDKGNVATFGSASLNLAGSQATGTGDEPWGAEQEVGTPERDDSRQESQSNLEFITGDQSSGRATEFTMPYAPDDRFVKIGTSYYSVKSDAATKANRFGRIQNKMLLGNRSGMNVTSVPELLPTAPFSPIFIQANGLTAMYRLNGTSWAIDSSGIVVSSDAMFWGGVSGTGNFWFPVAPGIVSLGSTPPTVDGQITAETLAPVWQETIILSSRTRSYAAISSFPYSMQLLTEVSVYSHHEVKVDPITLVTLTTRTTMTVELIEAFAVTSITLPTLWYYGNEGNVNVTVT